MLLHFVDIETSHLDPFQGEITEIAIVSYNMKTKSKKTFVKKIKLLNPEKADPKALEIGNYDKVVWEKEAVYFHDIAKDVFNILKDGMFVAHNVSFDYSFIKKQLSDCGYRKMTYKKFDTKDLIFEHLYPTLTSTSMMNVRDFFGWSTKDSHTALKDAEDCLKIFTTLNKCGFLKRNYFILKYKLRNFFLKSSNSWFQVIGLYL